MPYVVDVGELVAVDVDVGGTASSRGRKRAGRSGSGEQTGGARGVLRQLHDVLAVLVGHDLLDRRLGARSGAGQAGAERAQPVEPEHLGLAVQGGDALAQDRIAHTAAAAEEIDEHRGGRPPPHNEPADESITRSFESVTLANRHPSPSSPTRRDAGMRTSLKNT